MKTLKELAQTAYDMCGLIEDGLPADNTSTRLSLGVSEIARELTRMVDDTVYAAEHAFDGPKCPAYRNGRPAKAGDVIITRDFQGIPLTGVVVNTLTIGVCNLEVVPIPATGLHSYESTNCLHIQDVFPLQTIVPSAPPAPVHTS